VGSNRNAFARAAHVTIVLAMPPETATPTPPTELAPDEFYFDGPYLVFTAIYHLRRGYCCNSGCRHCPYEKADENTESC
jgi:Family of unknown function (DUF5522)